MGCQTTCFFVILILRFIASPIKNTMLVFVCVCVWMWM